jgi:hypothetical protein
LHIFEIGLLVERTYIKLIYFAIHLSNDDQNLMQIVYNNFNTERGRNPPFPFKIFAQRPAVKGIYSAGFEFAAQYV